MWLKWDFRLRRLLIKIQNKLLQEKDPKRKLDFSPPLYENVIGWNPQTRRSLCSAEQSLNPLYPSAPRPLAVTWTTSSATAGSWRRGSPTHSGRGPSRASCLALRWSCCIVSATTGWMLLMSLTCLRWTSQKQAFILFFFLITRVYSWELDSLGDSPFTVEVTVHSDV